MSTHIVEKKFVFYVFSILTFNLDLILELLLAFGDQNEVFGGLGSGSTIVLGCTYIVQPLLFPMPPSILSFDIDLILGAFWGPIVVFTGPQ